MGRKTDVNGILTVLPGLSAEMPFIWDGGGELPINCVDAERLKEAQQNPEKHGDLVVRLAGMSARSVDISRGMSKTKSSPQLTTFEKSHREFSKGKTAALQFLLLGCSPQQL
ncbi:MAG: hypothetical protein KGZ25_14980 [Planctomycetes bacterium]|nr:hypothetical protein [Planctomycetota bacterium]